MTIDLARRLAAAAIGVVGIYAMSRQCRRPTGWMGRRIARAMNAGHASLTAWGLTHVPVDASARVLDVGCGGGQTIQSIAAIATTGRIDGIDYAPSSVAVASEKNAALIADGRVTVQQASVSRLPFSEQTFDLVTAVETHYYWPDLVADFREVQRVLKPGGTFAIVAETHRGMRMDWLYRPVMLLLRATYLTAAEHRDLLTQAGYIEVETFEERASGWLCVVARKAS